MSTPRVAAVRAVLALLLVAGLTNRGQAQSQFRLVVPESPGLSSSALLTERELVVTDTQGASYRYVREPRFDSPDGQYVGFVNVGTQQAIRWPVLGQGPMILGDAQGLAWRASRQQVQPVGAGVAPGLGGGILPGGVPGVGIGPVIRPGPIAPGGGVVINPQPGFGGGVGVLPQQPGLAGWMGGATDVATGVDRNGNPQLALIDSTGLVRVYTGARGGWTYAAEMAGLDLVGGASLTLTPDITPGLPRVFTVTSGGALVMLTQGQGPLPFAPQIPFPRSAALSPVTDPRTPVSYAVDALGRLWQLDLLRQAHQLVDSTAGLFAPGARVQVLSRPGMLGVENTLFVTDQRGTILQYTPIAGGWAPRVELAYGFMPGSPVGAGTLHLPNGNTLLYLAAVDWRGQLQLLSGSPAGLQATVVDAGSLPPGANVLVQVGLEGPLLSAVGADGVWRVWRPGVNGVWTPTTLHPGFPPGAPVVSDPLTGGLLAVDVRGRMVPALWQNGSWDSSLIHPTIPLPPKLVSRNVVPNQPLPPARVTLVNGSPDEVVVQVSDAAAQANSREVRLPTGAAVQEVFERDAGATIEEVYLVPDGLGGLTQQVDRYPLPPQPRYALAVWANRTTYQFINKNPNKPAGAQPNFDLKTHVSLGVLSLPPGELLRDGTTLDVAAEAARNRNPGAAGAFGLPSGGVEVVPRP